MRIFQKTEYGLRAMFHLASDRSGEMIKSSTIASCQDIPLKFLETVLREFRTGGFVESRRGVSGGYRLLRPAESITVAEIFTFLGGPTETARRRQDAFTGMWNEIDASVCQILYSTTFAELVRRSKKESTTNGFPTASSRDQSSDSLAGQFV